VIVQVHKRKHFVYLTRYALGRGPVVVSNLAFPDSPVAAAVEMELEAVRALRCKKVALHYMLCPHPEDRIDPETWPALVRDFLHEMGLDGHLYLATLHDRQDGTCPHVHLIVCRVRDGRVWSDRFDYAKCTKVAMQIERRYALRRAPRGGNRWAKQEAPRPAGPHVWEFARPDPAGGPAPGIGGLSYVSCGCD